MVVGSSPAPGTNKISSADRNCYSALSLPQIARTGVSSFAFYLDFPSVAQLVEHVKTCSLFSRKGCDRMGYLVCITRGHRFESCRWV